MISAGGRQKLPHQEIQNDVCSIDAGNQAWMSDGRKRYSVGFGQSDAPPDGLVSRGMGPIRKHSLRCSIPLYRWRQTNSVIRSAPRILIVTTPIPGLTSTPIWRNPGHAGFKPPCFTTTRRTSPLIRSGRRGCASTGRRLWRSGDGTTPRSLPLEQRLSSAIFPDAEIHLLDADHFALDEKNDERASLILMFLVKHRV
jgi:hypothetical protein